MIKFSAAAEAVVSISSEDLKERLQKLESTPKAPVDVLTIFPELEKEDGRISVSNAANALRQQGDEEANWLWLFIQLIFRIRSPQAVDDYRKYTSYVYKGTAKERAMKLLQVIDIFGRTESKTRLESLLTEWELPDFMLVEKVDGEDLWEAVRDSDTVLSDAIEDRVNKQDEIALLITKSDEDKNYREARSLRESLEEVDDELDLLYLVQDIKRGDYEGAWDTLSSQGERPVADKMILLSLVYKLMKKSSGGRVAVSAPLRQKI